MIKKKKKLCDCLGLCSIHFLPGPVDGHKLVDCLSGNERAGVLRAVSDDFMDGVEDGHHCVLLQVLGWPLLSAGQVADQIPHGVTP